jgi:hypothetical protein
MVYVSHSHTLFEKLQYVGGVFALAAIALSVHDSECLAVWALIAWRQVGVPSTRERAPVEPLHTPHEPERCCS